MSRTSQHRAFVTKEGAKRNWTLFLHTSTNGGFVIVVINKLVKTAKAPEIAIPCPAIPSVTSKEWAIGVSRLTGINSEATSVKIQSAIANTPLQYEGFSSKFVHSQTNICETLLDSSFIRLFCYVCRFNEGKQCSLGYLPLCEIESTRLRLDGPVST